MLYWLGVIIMVRFVTEKVKQLQPVTSDLLKTLARNLSIITMAYYAIRKPLRHTFTH
jgi:hypothetical protein